MEKGVKKESEGRVEKALKREIGKLGGMAFKIHSGWFTGMPDRLIIVPGVPMRFVELKSSIGGLKPRQVWVHRKLRGMGVEVDVVNTTELVHEYVGKLRVEIENSKK